MLKQLRIVGAEGSCNLNDFGYRLIYYAIKGQQRPALLNGPIGPTAFIPQHAGPLSCSCVLLLPAEACDTGEDKCIFKESALKTIPGATLSVFYLSKCPSNSRVFPA